MRKAWVGLLAVWAAGVVVAACVGDAPADSGSGDSDSGTATDGTTGGGDGSLGGDGSGGSDSGVDSGPQCGYAGEECCGPPLTACNPGMACVSNACRANDIWAVGYYNEGITGPSVGISLHYDGNTWSNGPEIALTTTGATVSPQGLWGTTSGLYYTVTDEPSSFIYASGSWRKCGVSNCSAPNTAAALWAVYGFSSDDYWIAGSNVMFHCASTGCASTAGGLTGSWGDGAFTGSSSSDLWYPAFDRAFHYNGSTWSVISGRHATAMYAASATDVWAAGNQFIEHFDGSAWMTFAFTKPDGGTVGTLYAMGGSAADDVWVAGQNSDNSDFAGHWDGASWTYFPLPSATSFPSDVYVVSKKEAYILASSTILAWDGASWTAITTPDYDSGLFEEKGSWQGIFSSARARP